MRIEPARNYEDGVEPGVTLATPDSLPEVTPEETEETKDAVVLAAEDWLAQPAEGSKPKAAA
jgi:hypothetical protein